MAAKSCLDSEPNADHSITELLTSAVHEWSLLTSEENSLIEEAQPVEHTSNACNLFTLLNNLYSPVYSHQIVVVQGCIPSQPRFRDP